MTDTEKVDLKNDSAFKEWVQTQQVNSSLDTMILDIRKYGFSFITVLITAQGFLLGQVALNRISVLGIFIALLVLINVLFTVDRMHEVFLRGAVLNAMRIEKDLALGLSRSIAFWSEKGRTATWGVTSYAGFSFAAWVLCVAGMFRDSIGGQAVESPDAPWYNTTAAAFEVSVLALLLGVANLVWYHLESKGSQDSFKRYTEEYGKQQGWGDPAR